MVLPSGSMVWFETPADGWMPARVTQPGAKQMQVTVEGGAAHVLKVAEQDVGRVFAESLEPQGNMLVFKAPLAPCILHNLRLAHAEGGRPFSSVGAVLVACGASTACAPRQLWQHCRLSGDSAPQPPHIFELAGRAHRAMLQSGADQAIVLSGESGSGKSALAALCVQLLIEACPLGAARPRLPAAPAALRHLHAARLLAAFGAAETVRNRTASRFGKSTALHFEGGGECVGGEIQAFQLELSRVAGPSAGAADGRFRDERNYNIFYQLCIGAQPDLRDQLSLLDARDYCVTARSPHAVGEHQTDDRTDARDWLETEAAIAGLGCSKEDTGSLLGAVSAVLWLGNLDFAAAEGAAGPDSMQFVEGQSAGGGGPETAVVAARLLGVSRVELEKMLCYATVEAGKERADVPLSSAECADRRTLLMTHLYSRLFYQVVAMVNETLASTGDVCEIAIVDLPGHAEHEWNTSFENLCMNYTTEKLAAHCYRQLFKVEHALYVAEQFQVPELDKSLDNQPVIDLIEGNQHTMKTPGLLDLVHVATGMQGHNDDNTLLQELNDAFGAKKQLHQSYSKSLVQPKPPAPKISGFLVRHTAGDVNYSISGFVSSNTKLPEHLKSAMQKSSHRFLANLFLDQGNSDEQAELRAQTQAGVTLTTQKQLFTGVARVACHFVRCIRPAAVLVPGRFDGLYVQAQLWTSQISDLTAERQFGFPIRYPPASFSKRFNMLSTRGATKAEQLLKEVADPGGWMIGTTNVFLKDTCSVALEKARSAKVAESVLVIEGWMNSVRAVPTWRARIGPMVQMQAIARGVLARSEFHQMRKDRQHMAALTAALAAAATRMSGGTPDPEDLEHLVESVTSACEFDYPTTALTYLIIGGKRVVTELRAYRRAEKLLSDAVSPPSKISLLEALYESKKIGLTSGALAERALASYNQSYAPKAGRGTDADAKEAKSSLKQAVDYYTKNPGERWDDRRRRLTFSIEMVKGLNLGGVQKLLEDAEAAVNQLTAEMEWIADNQTAMDAQMSHYLAGSVDRGQKHKVNLQEQLTEAQQLLDELQQGEIQETALSEALAKDSPAALRAAIGKVGNGPEPDSFEKAQTRYKYLRGEAKRFSTRFAAFAGGGQKKSAADKKKPAKARATSGADIDINVPAFVSERQEFRLSLKAAPMLRSYSDDVLAFEPPPSMLSMSLTSTYFNERVVSNRENYIKDGPKEFAAEALMTARALLGWTGDAPYVCNWLCATDILERGQSSPQLGDETILQLCRHTNGTDGLSCVRAFQLLQLCCAVFGKALSPALKPYLLQYLYDQVVSESSGFTIQKLAAESIANVLRGSNDDIPSADELEGLRSGEAMRDKLITTADGSTRVPIEDQSSVSEIATAAADARGAQFGSEYGLYATDGTVASGGGDGTGMARIGLLPSDELTTAIRNIGGDTEADLEDGAKKKKKRKGKDGARRADPRLYLMKRLVFHGEVETATEPDVHQLYTQCKDVTHNFGISDPSEALLLAALAARADDGETPPETPELVAEWLEARIPPGLYKRWRPDSWVADFVIVSTKMDGWSKLEAKGPKNDVILFEK